MRNEKGYHWLRALSGTQKQCSLTRSVAHLICLIQPLTCVLCDILFSSALIVAIYRPALSFIIFSSLFLTHGAGSIIRTMLSLHNIICNSCSAIKDHPTITPTNITTKLSAPLQSSININKSNLLALINEILLSELLFNIERQVESKNITISIVHWPSSSSLLLLLPRTIYNQPNKLVYIKRSFLINID